MKADVTIFRADGFEEVEALTVSDILRRAKADVALVSIKDTKEVESSRGVKVVADATFDEMDFSETRILVLPGGMPGTNNLQAFKPLEELVLALRRWKNGCGHLRGSEDSRCTRHVKRTQSVLPSRI